MENVGKQIGSGAFFIACAKYSGVIINLIVTAVLARILSPNDFGIVALTTVFVSFFDLMGNMGMGPAIIQNKQLNNDDLGSIFNFIGLASLLLAVICFISATPISNYYSNDVLVPIMRILSIQLFFIILNVVPYSLLLKEKRFKYISLSTLICQFVFGAIAIIAAYWGVGIYSLLIAPVMTSVIMFALCYHKSRSLYGRYLIRSIRGSSISKVLSFSVFQFLFNVVNYFTRNLDKLLLGKKFSMSDLGYYEKSYRLMTLPISNISSVLSPTIQPVLSDYQNDKLKLRSYVSSIIKILAYVGAVLTPLCFFASSEIILIVFGDQWMPSIPIFQILSLSIFAQVVDSASGSILQSANAPKVLFFSGIICAVINVASIVIGIFVFESLVWMSALLDIAFVVNLIIDLFFIFRVALRSSFLSAFSIFKHPFIIVSIESISLFLISKIGINNIWISFLLKGFVIISEAFIYGLYFKLFSIDKVYSLISRK